MQDPSFPPIATSDMARLEKLQNVQQFWNHGVKYNANLPSKFLLRDEAIFKQIVA
jgi:hypothetical protein